MSLISTALSFSVMYLTFSLNIIVNILLLVGILIVTLMLCWKGAQLLKFVLVLNNLSKPLGLVDIWRHQHP